MPILLGDEGYVVQIPVSQILQDTGFCCITRFLRFEFQKSEGIIIMTYIFQIMGYHICIVIHKRIPWTMYSLLVACIIRECLSYLIQAHLIQAALRYFYVFGRSDVSIHAEPR
jgi:hypothetical protein